MVVLRGTCIILFLGLIYCYNNICERTSCAATQSSTRNALSADRVIDGKIYQNEFNCSHTALNKSVAWVMVDLRKEYQVKNVVIYYRDEAKSKSKWMPYRFRQYSLEVSNSSGTHQWIECFKDNTTYPLVPPSIQNISCDKTTRYLRITTTYDAPEDGPVRGAILEICEIQVFAVVICSPNCVDMQCHDNGYCTRGCNQGHWGDECQNNCPLTCQSRACNKSNGICNSCSNGYFGDKCEESCSSSCSEQKCHKDTGYCVNDCVPGYFGNYCNLTCGRCSTGSCDRYCGNCETCNTGYYGEKCNIICNYTCLNQECMKINGHCSNGCSSGFYGEFCNLLCSENCAQTDCRQNGTCIGGCKPNWIGEKCDIINPASGNCSNTDVYSALYGVITILFISISINVLFIVRNVRQNISNIENSEMITNQKNQTRDSNIAIYDRVEDNTDYQELGQLSQPSHYENLN